MIIHIEKGNHYRSNHLLTKLKIGRSWCQKYTIRFLSSAEYELSENKTQVNKLVGCGQLHHHFNSIRVGWRYSVAKNCVELFSYSYTNGERHYTFLKDVKIGQDFNVIVEYEAKGKKSLYRILVDEILCYNSWELTKWWQRVPLLYECFPYFGGTMPAPKNINILIKSKK